MCSFVDSFRVLNSQTSTSLQLTDFSEVDHLVTTIDHIPYDDSLPSDDGNTDGNVNSDFADTISVVIAELNKRQSSLILYTVLFHVS